MENKLARNSPHRGPRRLEKKSPLAGSTSSESQELIRQARIGQFLVGDDDLSLEEKILFSILNFVRRGNLPTLEGWNSYLGDDCIAHVRARNRVCCAKARGSRRPFSTFWILECRGTTLCIIIKGRGYVAQRRDKLDPTSGRLHTKPERQGQVLVYLYMRDDNRLLQNHALPVLHVFKMHVLKFISAPASSPVTTRLFTPRLAQRIFNSPHLPPQEPTYESAAFFDLVMCCYPVLRP